MVQKNEFPKDGVLRDQLKFFVNYAVLAPSGHNTQPWKFQIKNTGIDLFVDMLRALPKSDVNHRQTLISLGCALENFLIAADYFGFGCEVEYFPTSQQEIVARVECSKRVAVGKKGDHLLDYIPKRWTDRHQYSKTPIEEPIIHSFKNFVFEDIQIDFVGWDQKEKMNVIADKAVEAGIVAMHSNGFRDELSQYVKPSSTDSTVGMPGHTLGVPALMSFFLPTMIKRFNMAQVNKMKDTSLLKKHTPVFGIISTKDDTHRAWVKAGQCFERIFLEAGRYGLHVAPLAAIVQTGEYYKDLQKILRISMRPQVFFRMGYSKRQPVHSPRIMGWEVVGK